LSVVLVGEHSQWHQINCYKNLYCTNCPDVEGKGG
jgi:hypothetical protein